jgi:hypothetical protein
MSIRTSRASKQWTVKPLVEQSRVDKVLRAGYALMNAPSSVGVIHGDGTPKPNDLHMQSETAAETAMRLFRYFDIHDLEDRGIVWSEFQDAFDNNTTVERLYESFAMDVKRPYEAFAMSAADEMSGSIEYKTQLWSADPDLPKWHATPCTIVFNYKFLKEDKLYLMVDVTLQDMDGKKAKQKVGSFIRNSTTFQNNDSNGFNVDTFKSIIADAAPKKVNKWWKDNLKSIR